MDAIYKCPICGQIICIQADGKKQQLRPVNGLFYELGYSIGGWGRRQDFLPKFADEICDDCFQEIAPKITEFAEFVGKMKDSRRDGIIIYRQITHEKESNVQAQANHDRKSSRMGITGKILRFLGKHEG
jgi:hypothetical protein